MTAALAAIVLAVGVSGYGDPDAVDRTAAAIEQAVDDVGLALASTRDATIDWLGAFRDDVVQAGTSAENAADDAIAGTRAAVADVIDTIERLLDDLEGVVRG